MNSFKVIAYISDGSNYMINLDNFNNIDHVNYCFATVKDKEGNLNINFKNLDKVEKLQKDYPHLKFSLSIGGWTAGNFSEMAETKEGRERFISQAVKFVEERNFDGIDMDWEYPCDGSSGISYHFKDRENYTHLSRELRKALDVLQEKYKKKYYLSLAIGATENSMNSFEVEALNAYYDYLNIMNYDYIGMDRVSCHHSNLFESSKTPHKKSADFYMKMFIEAGLDRNKIIFGFPFYGRGGTGVENKGDGLGNRMYGSVPRFFDYDYIDKLKKENPQNVYFDEEAYGEYYFDGDMFITYDSQEAITKKMEYIKENGFAGIMFWEYAIDPTGQLMKSLISAL